MPGKSSRAPPRTKLERTCCILLGRNGHDGAGVASPDPLLLAPDPMSGFTAYKTRYNLGSYHFFLPIFVYTVPAATVIKCRRASYIRIDGGCASYVGIDGGRPFWFSLAECSAAVGLYCLPNGVG